MLNQNQPNDFVINTINHGEPTDNKPQSVKIFFDSLPNKRINYDLSYLSDTQSFNLVQTVFIDNYENDGDVIIEIDETKQRIVCKAGKQGYFPILAYERLKLSVKHTGTKQVKVPIYFLNFIISQGSW